MNSDLYRIVYCSRNEIRGTVEESVDAQFSLLEAARTKNRRLNVTGALLSQAGVFAQVLEGPQKSVEHLFSLVQHDGRNSDVTIGLRGPILERDFPNWAMAFGNGESTSGFSPAQAVFDAVFANQEDAGEDLLALLKALVNRENDFRM